MLPALHRSIFFYGLLLGLLSGCSKNQPQLAKPKISDTKLLFTVEGAAVSKDQEGLHIADLNQEVQIKAVVNDTTPVDHWQIVGERGQTSTQTGQTCVLSRSQYEVVQVHALDASGQVMPSPQVCWIQWKGTVALTVEPGSHITCAEKNAPDPLSQLFVNAKLSNQLGKPINTVDYALRVTLTDADGKTLNTFSGREFVLAVIQLGGSDNAKDHVKGQPKNSLSFHPQRLEHGTSTTVSFSEELLLWDTTEPRHKSKPGLPYSPNLVFDDLKSADDAMFDKESLPEEENGESKSQYVPESQLGDLPWEGTLQWELIDVRTEEVLQKGQTEVKQKKKGGYEDESSSFDCESEQIDQISLT